MLAACETSSAPPAMAAPDASDGAVDVDAVDSGADGPATCALPASFGSRKCNECVGQTCCAPLADCTAEPTCDALMKCTLGCIDEVDAGACANDCLTQYPDADAGVKWRVLEQCAGFTEPCRFHCATQY